MAFEIALPEDDSRTFGDYIDALKRRGKPALVMADESIRSRAASMARDLYMLGRVRSLAEIEAAIEGTSLEAVNAFLRAHPYRDPWEGLLGEVEDV